MLIRKAQPCDSKESSKLIYESGSKICDFMFKTKRKDTLDFIKFEFNSNKGFFSHKNMFTGVVDTEIVANIGTYFEYKLKNLMIETLINAFKFYSFGEFIQVFKRIIYLKKITPNLKPLSLYVGNLAIKKQYREKGYGTQLINSVIIFAQEQQQEFLCFDVYEDNKRAIKLYERIGCIKGGTDSVFLASELLPKQIRMFKKLGCSN
ncbi:GNAT family N-acetyltransferase [Candidatus Uabimicrobium sp. HlEnr_7]|uniref:GNAT family N-acetyltransferase n=1 Tax=Candidatus Uabimicrobium helgolandensis TaxID=3095367 RepID=UPI003556FA87